jgi:hypothetical protein
MNWQAWWIANQVIATNDRPEVTAFHEWLVKWALAQFQADEAERKNLSQIATRSK